MRGTMNIATIDDATTAAVFRATLQLGIATPADLVPWADTQVLGRERPAGWVLDLSVGGGRTVEATLDALADPAFGADPAQVFRLILGLIDVAEGWTFDRAGLASLWCRRAAEQWGGDDAYRQALAVDHRVHSAMDAAADHQAAAIAAVVAYIAKYADATARTWLPNVRVRLDAAAG